MPFMAIPIFLLFSFGKKNLDLEQDEEKFLALFCCWSGCFISHSHSCFRNALFE